MSTIALALLCLTAHATPTDQGWASIDAELAAVAQELEGPSRSGPNWSGFVRVSYAHSSEPAIDSVGDPAPDDEFSGFAFENIRLAADGVLGDHSWGVSFDFGGLELQNSLIDAWIGFKAWGSATLYLGQMRTPFLRTALLPETTNLFVQRTRSGFLWTIRDTGLRIDNNFGEVRLRLSQQNGDDGVGDKLRSTARLEWDAMGGPAPEVEGAYGAGDALKLNVGAALTNDAALEGDELAWAFDAVATWGEFALQAELVHYGDGYDTLSDPNATVDIEGDTTPWSLTGSWMFMDAWEAAVRWEDYDESVNQRDALSLGVNRYIDGHDLKWQLNYIDVNGEFASDNEFLVLGATLAF